MGIWALVDHEPAQRIEPAAAAVRPGDEHQHLACRRCGEVTDVGSTVGAAPCIEPTAASGFVIDGAEVTYWGLCPGCQATAEPRP